MAKPESLMSQGPRKKWSHIGNYDASSGVTFGLCRRVWPFLERTRKKYLVWMWSQDTTEAGGVTLKGDVNVQSWGGVGGWIEPLGLICIYTVDTMYKIDNWCEPLYSTWNSEWKGNPKRGYVYVYSWLTAAQQKLIQPGKSTPTKINFRKSSIFFNFEEHFPSEKDSVSGR